MDFIKLIEQLVPIIGQKAADALADQIKGLISDESPAWQKTVLALVADAVEKHGVLGIQIALQEIEKLLEGETPDIDFANLLVASDIVAMLEKAEAEKKTEVRDFLSKVGDVLGGILAGVIRGLLAG